MIISQTPVRMSFFGGGTDFPEFYKEHSGSVISTTFNKYCHVIVRPLPPKLFEYKTKLMYAQIEEVASVDDIKHPAIRNAMKWLGLERIFLNYDADIPAKTGLGTSSAFSVGMLNAFYTMQGITKTKRELADDAIYLERTLCNEEGGIQDQIAAAYGGFNRIDFNADGYTVTPLDISAERKQKLSDNLMVFFTGLSRYSFHVQKATKSMLGKRTQELLEILGMVDDAEKILTDPLCSLDDFGLMLNETWMLKRSISSEISNSMIDDIYIKALKAGALGGKLLGAGGGGCLLFYVPEEKQKSVRLALSDLYEIDFEFESEGTKIICN
ncbi:MAG: kinase, partial [Clostridia bacterium]|nr:kinase [Clostridia bacterium]